MSRDVSHFHTILPWNFITEFCEGVVVQKDGTLQRSFAYRAPDVDSLGMEDINEISIRVNDFSKRLGTGWAFFIEAQRFCLQEYPRDLRFSSTFDSLAPYLIEKEREKSFTAAGKHFDSCYYITVVWKPPSDNAKKLTKMFISSPSKGESTLQENVEYFVAETDSAMGILSNSVLITPLNNEETVEYLHSAVSFRRHWIRFPNNLINLNRILCDSELRTSETMKLGDHYIPIVGVNDFPHDTYPAILEALNRTRIEYRWVTRYICLSKEEGKAEAQKKEKSHRGSQDSFVQSIAKAASKDGTSGSKTINHGAAVKEQDSIDAGKDIDLDIASLGYYTSCVMVWHEDYEKALGKAKTIRNVINSAGFTCKEETWNAFESFRSMMPGDVYSNYRALPVMSYNSAHCVPLSSVWAGLRQNEHAGHVTGVDLPHVTCSTHEGTPFYLNLNPGGDVGHAAIWGPTGAGKSTLLNLLEMQFFRYPDSQVVVFDKGRSCRQICLACGGLFFEPAGESFAGVSFQPLRDLDTDRDMQNASDFIESLFVVNNVPVTPLMRTSIKNALDLMRTKPVEARHITTFLQYCEYKDPVEGRNTMKEQLADYRWDGGKFGKVFDSRSSAMSLDTRFLAIEMESLMNRGDGCIVPALVYLFNLLDKKFDGCRLTMLVLDEAWLFLKNEIFAEKIAEWLKVLRKKNVFVVFATQDVADVEKSPLKTTIVQQCLTKIYLADKFAFTEAMRRVYGAFGLTDTEIGYISSAQMKRDYFYTSPLGRRMFQLDLGRLTLALIGTPRHSLLDRLIMEKGAGVPLCADILDSYGVNYKPLVGMDAPKECLPGPAVRKTKTLPAPAVHAPPFLPEGTPAAASSSSRLAPSAGAILDAVASVPERRKRGGGRTADVLAKEFNVSSATIYRAKAVLESGDMELIGRVRRGDISLKKAFKILSQSKAAV